MKKKISKKDIEDWNNFVNKSEKLEDKDNQLNFTINQLSEKTFVEETESLKKGAAGAGLTDND